MWWPDVLRDEMVTKKVPEYVHGIISSVAGCTVSLKSAGTFIWF